MKQSPPEAPKQRRDEEKIRTKELPQMNHRSKKKKKKKKKKKEKYSCLGTISRKGGWVGGADKPVLDDLEHFSNIKENLSKLPTWHWLPKLHKRPYKNDLSQTFIHAL